MSCPAELVVHLELLVKIALFDGTIPTVPLCNSQMISGL
jgi:hypothetical protein